MISKIGDVFKLKSSIDELTKTLKENKNSILSLSKEIKTLTFEVDLQKNTVLELKKENQDFKKIFQKVVESVKSKNDEFSKEINDFKVSKTKMQNEAVKDFQLSIKDMKDLVKNDISSVKNFKKEFDMQIESVKKSTLDFNSEIQKFNRVSKSIKEMDFELSKYADRLEKSNHERLKMMKEIDRLQSMIGKMKRQK